MNRNKIANNTFNSIFESGNTTDLFDEILVLLQAIAPQLNMDRLCKVHDDVAELFAESRLGTPNNIGSYHNLRHTRSVVLATARLFHGLYHEQVAVSDELLFQGLLSAYFHDLGLLKQPVDQKNGRQSIFYHESQSIHILDDYLKKNNLPQKYSTNCASIIYSTSLKWAPGRNIGIDKQLELCCQVVATADILAQMADRYYVESLPLLFEEQRDCGITDHESALDLLRETTHFHEQIVKKRLEVTLGNLVPSMQTHFRIRWDIDKNLYAENIDLNLNYLKEITHNCANDFECWKKRLRRKPPSSDHF